jgi:cytochrome c oxidase assembly protein subunit 15
MGDAAPPLPRLLGAADDDLAHALARAFAALCALTTGLIVLGALVRAHGAGLACPDWPLCFGEVVPRFDLEVAFEWTHRLVAGSMSLVFAALAVLVLRRPALRRRVGRALGVAAALLAAQVLLGALTVWHLLAAWTVTAHLIVGNSFNACLLLLALQLGRGPEAAGERAPARVRGLLLATGALLAIQLVLGGLVSSTYAGLACPQWPQCNGGYWFPSLRGAVGLHLAHRWNAVLLLAALAAVAVAARGLPRLGRLTALALALGVVQLAAGVANVLLSIPVEVTGLHSLLAALLVLAAAAAFHEAFRNRVNA